MITAVDGVPIRAKLVDSLVIFPGERYDLQINALKTPEKPWFYIIFEGLERYNWELKKTVSPTIALAKLKYEKFNYDTNNYR